MKPKPMPEVPVGFILAFVIMLIISVVTIVTGLFDILRILLTGVCN